MYFKSYLGRRAASCWALPHISSFIFFNQTQDLRAPSADRHETLPRDHYLLGIDNPGPKIQGPSPEKFGGAKNMQNLDRFYTTSDFHREYLRKETRYQKSERHTISSDSSGVQSNKTGELRSTIHKVVHASLDPPNSTFSTDCISAPSGCWVLKFLHTLEFDKAFVAHVEIGVRGPLKILRVNI